MRRCGVNLAINCAPDHPSRCVIAHGLAFPHSSSPLPGLRPVVLSGLGLGVLFGSLDVGVVAFTAGQGNGEFAGIALACFAAASMVGGILMESAHGPDPFSVIRKSAAAATAAVMLIVPFVPGNATLAMLPPLPAFASPHVDWPVHPYPGLVPARNVTEGLTWTNSGLATGFALGSAVAGILVDAYGPRFGLGTGLAGALCAAPPSWSGRPPSVEMSISCHRRRRKPACTGMERRSRPGATSRRLGTNPPATYSTQRHAVSFCCCVSGGHSATAEPARDSGTCSRRRVAGSRRVGNRLATGQGHPLREPPLGERAYMAEQARDVEISRSRGGSTLHQSVCTRLSVDPDGTDVTWDSYRSYDGRWVVTAYHAHQGVGTWYYEAVGRTVHPADASARALMGGGPTGVADDAHTTTGAGAGRPTDSPAVANEPSDTTTDDEPQQAPRPRLVSITSDPTSDRPPRRRPPMRCPK